MFTYKHEHTLKLVIYNYSKPKFDLKIEHVLENYLIMVTNRYFDLNTTYVKGSGDLFKTDKAKLPGKLLGLFNVQCQSELTFLSKHDTVNSW